MTRDEAMKLIGVVPDAQIAREIKVSRQRVQQLRRQLGIGVAPRTGIPKREMLPPKFLAALGTDTDAAVGARFGLAGMTVYQRRRRRGIAAKPKPTALEPFLHLFGVVSDREIARKAGLSTGAVGAYRTDHPGLPLSPLSRKKP